MPARIVGKLFGIKTTKRVIYDPLTHYKGSNMKCFIVSSKPFDQEEVYTVLKKFDISTTSFISKADFILAIGGDGAVIKAFHELDFKHRPILGYNTGTLGFLSSGRDLEDLLTEYVNGKMIRSGRQFISVNYEDSYKDQQYHDIDYALNEVAIVGTETGTLVELDLSLDFNCEETDVITTYKGDGLIVATPTGSTAYNLSVGGPIIEPWCESMVISPISPFTLSSRPLVVDSSTIVYIDRCDKIIIDGKVVRYPQGTKIKIRMDSYATLLKRVDDTFYDSIKSKLGWERSIK